MVSAALPPDLSRFAVIVVMRLDPAVAPFRAVLASAFQEMPSLAEGVRVGPAVGAQSLLRRQLAVPRAVFALVARVAVSAVTLAGAPARIPTFTPRNYQMFHVPSVPQSTFRVNDLGSKKA